MKLKHTPLCRANQGSMLLVVMGVIVVLGIVLAAVLSLTTHEHRLIARTAAWNAALPMPEAGIEEAMSHLRQVNFGSLGVNGWQPVGLTFVSKGTLSNGRYVVAISDTSPPIIHSLGQIWSPSAGRYIDRRVLVTTHVWGSFTRGLVARRDITMSGEFYADSFDSSKPELSNNGQYDPAKRSDNGDIGSNLSMPSAIELRTKINALVSSGTGT